MKGLLGDLQVMVRRRSIGKWMKPINYNLTTAVSNGLLIETILIVEKTELKGKNLCVIWALYIEKL